MATHTDTASVTYGALERILNKKILDLLCPVGKDLILSYDLGSDYATKLAAMFPGTTWSGKTTVKCGSIKADGALFLNVEENLSFVSQLYLSEDAKLPNNYPGVFMPNVSSGFGINKKLHYNSGLTLSNTQYWYHRTA